MSPLEVILRRFESPDEVRLFEKGRLELITLAGTTIGRASYEPGWKWSVHVGPTVGATRCTVEHLGMVLSGQATAAFDDGRLYNLTPGTVFYIPADPHDSWVVGDVPYEPSAGSASRARNPTPDVATAPILSLSQAQRYLRAGQLAS